MSINKQKVRQRRLKKGFKKKERFLDEVSKGHLPPFIDSNDSLLPTNRPIRISKVAKELNKGIAEIIHFLRDNGFDIENNPNVKLTIEHIEILNGIRKKKEIDSTLVLDYTWKLLEDLKIDYKIIFTITPEQFEHLVAEFLTKSKFTVRLNGKTNRKDGGIDIIAWKKDIVTVILAIQVKFKEDWSKKVTAGEVRDFKGALAINDYFTAGMVVTNTDFTEDARWIEEKLNSKIELKNYDDIKNWMNENFVSRKEIVFDLNLGKDVYFNEIIK